MAFVDLIEKSIDRYFACWPRRKPDLINISNSHLVAHRGAHDNNIQFIENTIAAFDRAVVLGCDGIEFDIHATADQVLVINHDHDLKRLWNKNATISQLSFQELRQLVPAIPSLDEVIKRYSKKIHLFIELKSPFNAQQSLFNSLQTLTAVDDYHLLCLDETVFAVPTKFPSAALLLVPVHHNVQQFCQTSMEKNYGGVLGHYLLLNQVKVEKLKLAKQLIGVGFVNSKFSLYRELNRGIEWLFSDNVAVVGPCLQRLRALTLSSLS